MIRLIKKKVKKKKICFQNSLIGNIDIFFIDKQFEFVDNIDVKIQNKLKKIDFIGPLGILSMRFFDNILFLKKSKKIFLICLSEKNKKKILNLYLSLIKIKLKGVLQSFKINLILNGIGFKTFIEKNILTLKLGYSHNINIKVPDQIKIINKSNILIFKSNDFIFLTQFIHFIKRYKKSEPYKGKGLLLKNEKILRKEGKKSKK